jgi:hypothetical protein
MGILTNAVYLAEEMWHRRPADGEDQHGRDGHAT